MDFSEDQTRALARIEALLREAGVDLETRSLTPPGGKDAQTLPTTLAVLGRAGSGKTVLLAHLVRGLIAANTPPTQT